MEKTLFLHGRVITMDARRESAEAVYVENGRIVDVGTSQDFLLHWGRADVRRVDWQGATVYPGWVDSHVHLAAYGMLRHRLDLNGTKSKGEMLCLLREIAARTPEGEWIVGVNWDENQWAEREVPHREELDAVSLRHPVFLTRICHHAHVANTVAFRVAGVGLEPDDPEEGKYGRDPDGKINGMIYENASRPFFAAIPEPTAEQKRSYIREAVKEALALGLTAAHTEDLRVMGSVRELLREYRGLVEAGVWFRTHHLLYHPHLDEAVELGLQAGTGDEWTDVGAVKIFADGAIGARTAWLSEPYADAPETAGEPVHSDDELAGWVSRAREAGFPVAIHAIGDRAAEQVINTWERHPSPKETRYRDRLIHVQVLRPDLLARMSELSFVADIQPRFVASDFPWVQDRLGTERLPYAYAWKSLLDAGVVCAGGSDAPIEPLNPLLGIHAAVTRRHPEEFPHPGYGPEQRLTVKEALRLWTAGSAYAEGKEMERGSITPGKWADFTVLDRTLSDTEPDEILQARVIMTVVNGKVAYQGNKDV
ncbi:amidohydrolase [Polycladomyces subterraneus]